MQTALLFFRGSGPAAAFIRWWTKSRFSHVAPVILFGDGLEEPVYNAYWSTGVTCSPLNRLDYLTGTGYCDVQHLPFDEAKTAEKYRWLEQQVGKPYDKPSILIIGLTKRIPGWLHVYVSRQGEWICSRLASVFAEIETECWGLNGPPSPEDVHCIVKGKYGIVKGKYGL